MPLLTKEEYEKVLETLPPNVKAEPIFAAFQVFVSVLPPDTPFDLRDTHKELGKKLHAWFTGWVCEGYPMELTTVRLKLYENAYSLGLTPMEYEVVIALGTRHGD